MNKESLERLEKLEEENKELKEELQIANDNLEVKQSFNDRQFDLLMKFDKVFSILKEILFLEYDTSLDNKKEFYRLYMTGTYPYENYRDVSKEQYELLKEVFGE